MIHAPRNFLGEGTQQPQSASASGQTGAEVENPSAGRNDKASGLIITRGVSLILLALLFGFLASLLLRDQPSDWEPYATELADTVWLTYFGVMLALSVVALILGVVSLARPAAHPVYSVIGGVVVIVVGAAGCVLGLLSVGNSVETMGTTLTYLGVGFLFALGGAITTLLSAISLGDRHRSGAWPRSVGLQAGVQPGPLGMRFLARLIDGILVGIIAVPLAWLAENYIGPTVGGLFFGLFSGLLVFVYFVGFEVSEGWTLGKKLLGMRVQGAAGTAKPTVRQSAIRNAFTLLVIIPFIGTFLALVAWIVIAATIQSSPTNQGEHDKFAGGTQVVKV